MSRSTRKTPKCGYTNSDSEKKDKQRANRRLRRAVNKTDLTIAEILPVTKDYCMALGRKQWLYDTCDKSERDRIMRK